VNSLLLCLEKSIFFGYVFFWDQLMWWLVMTSETGYIEFIRSTQESDGLFWDDIDFLERYCLNSFRTTASGSVQIPHPRSMINSLLLGDRWLPTCPRFLFPAASHPLPLSCSFCVACLGKENTKHFENVYLAMFEPKIFGFLCDMAGNCWYKKLHVNKNNLQDLLDDSFAKYQLQCVNFRYA